MPQCITRKRFVIHGDSRRTENLVDLPSCRSWHRGPLILYATEDIFTLHSSFPLLDRGSYRRPKRNGNGLSPIPLRNVEPLLTDVFVMRRHVRLWLNPDMPAKPHYIRFTPNNGPTRRQQLLTTSRHGPIQTYVVVDNLYGSKHLHQRQRWRWRWR